MKRWRLKEGVRVDPDTRWKPADKLHSVIFPNCWEYLSVGNSVNSKHNVRSSNNLVDKDKTNAGSLGCDHLSVPFDLSEISLMHINSYNKCKLAKVSFSSPDPKELKRSFSERARKTCTVSAKTLLQENQHILIFLMEKK